MSICFSPSPRNCEKPIFLGCVTSVCICVWSCPLPSCLLIMAQSVCSAWSYIYVFLHVFLRLCLYFCVLCLLCVLCFYLCVCISVFVFMCLLFVFGLSHWPVACLAWPLLGLTSMYIWHSCLSFGIFLFGLVQARASLVRALPPLLCSSTGSTTTFMHLLVLHLAQGDKNNEVQLQFTSVVLLLDPPPPLHLLLEVYYGVRQLTDIYPVHCKSPPSSPS